MTKKEQREFVLRLLKVGGAGTADKAYIFELYKLYIDPTHLSWTDSSCNSCSSSIQMMWQKVKDYILSENFIIENEKKK